MPLKALRMIHSDSPHTWALSKEIRSEPFLLRALGTEGVDTRAPRSALPAFQGQGLEAMLEIVPAALIDLLHRLLIESFSEVVALEVLVGAAVASLEASWKQAVATYVERKAAGAEDVPFTPAHHELHGLILQPALAKQIATFFH